MIYGMVLFIILLIGMSIFDLRKVKSFEDFVVAGKKQDFWPVYLSLMTSMIGASATLGVAERVWDIGFPAFWWLGVGAIGLMAQGLFLSKKIRNLDATTLPDIAQKTVGSEAKTVISIIIAVSWVGIVGAQIVSLTKIVQAACGIREENKLIIIMTLVVVVYTILGGQLSVVKTDMLQAGVIFLGIIGTFLYLFMCKNDNCIEIYNNIELLNKEFSSFDLINLLFITGGTYFLGPDIISRNIMSKDSKVATKATLVASVTLAITGVIITFLGMWSLYNIIELKGENPLIYIMNSVIPMPLAILLCIALIATLLSSADTCLVNAATIIEHDILKRNNVWEVRLIIGIMGVCALFVSMTKADIIDLLLGAYSVYSPGIVCPLTVAIIFYKKRNINKKIWFLAVLTGGLLGIIHSYFSIGPSFLPLLGMGISLGFSLLSVLQRPTKKC